MYFARMNLTTGVLARMNYRRFCKDEFNYQRSCKDELTTCVLNKGSRDKGWEV